MNQIIRFSPCSHVTLYTESMNIRLSVRLPDATASCWKIPF